MNKSTTLGRTTALALGLALIAGVAFGEDDPKARKALDDASAFIANTSSFTFLTEIKLDIAVDNAEESDLTTYMSMYSRAGKLMLRVSNPELDVEFWANQDGLITFIPLFEQYMLDESETDVSKIVAASGYGPIEPALVAIGELFKVKPFDGFISEDGEITYVGEAIIDGVKTHHLKIDDNGGSWEIWVEQGDSPLIRRLVPDVSTLLATVKENGFNGTLKVTAELKDWSLNDVSEDDLAFKAPDGVEKVAQFIPPAPPSPSDVLVGKTAPEFDLELLEGGNVNLAALAGDKIVILDFWATWCGPCRMAMPIIDKVAKAFEDKDVSLYAVNLQEDPDSIRSFLKSMNLEMNVALDKDGDVARRYMANGIPQTVIVGKDGSVQAVHVGLLPNLESVLNKELTTLTSGENLVETSS